MPIRFRCEACQQPIEVDDEAAGQSATCPYCKGLTPVPAFSTFGGAADVPVAAPSPAADVHPQPGAGPFPQVMPPRPLFSAPLQPAGVPAPRHAILSWLALASALIMIVCFGFYVVLSFSLMAEFGDSEMSPTQMMEKVQPKLAGRLDIFGTMFAAVAFLCLSLILGTVALALRAVPRWPAVVAVSLCAIVCGCFCTGLLQMLFS